MAMAAGSVSAYKGKHPIARHILLAIGVGACQWSTAAFAAQNLKIDPRIESAISASDNVFLTSTDKVTDIVAVFSTGVNARAKTKKFNVSVDYNVDHLRFLKEGDTDLRHSAFGTVAAEIIEDQLSFSGRAGIKQAFIDAEGGFSNSMANINSNRRTVQSYTGGLTWRGRIRDWSNLLVSYEVGTILSGADNLDDETLPVNFSDSVTHNFLARASTGDRFNYFELATYFQEQRAKKSLTTRDYLSQSYGAELWFQPNRYIRLLGGYGQRKNNARTERLAEDGGFVEYGVQLTPGPKSTLMVKRNQGQTLDSWSGVLRYLMTKRLELNGEYVDEVSTNALVLVDNLKDLNFNDDFGIADGNGLPIDESLFKFTLSDTDFRRKSASVSLKLRTRKTMYFMSVFREDRLFDNDQGDAFSKGISGGFKREINRLTKLSANVSYRKNGFESVDRRDEFVTASLAWDKTLSKYFETNVTLSHSRRISTADSELRENSIVWKLRGSF